MIKLNLIIIFIICAFLIISVVSEDDYYKVLHVERDATKNEIRKSYKKLSRKYHPDKNPGDKKAEEKFLELTEAYEVLMDDEKRKIYNRSGKEGLKNSNEQRGGNPFDFFNQFHHQGHAEEMKGPSIKVDVEVTLKELYLGTTVEVDVNKKMICPHCGGTGANSFDGFKVCDSCGGSGKKMLQFMLGPGIFQQVQTNCDVCGGTGSIIKEKCEICHGHKTIRGNDLVTITIEKGMKDGQEIVVEEEADQFPNARSGDLIFTIVTQKHKTFVRKNDDLYMTMEITFFESLIGFSKKIKHLDDHEITIERSGITKPNHVISKENEGMPMANGDYGKLFIEFVVVYPDSLTTKQIEAIKSNF